MKKLILLSSLFCLLSSFAVIDTDNDGVSDEKDMCPRVYARSTTGCPTLSPVKLLEDINSCYKQQKSQIIVRVQPICDSVSKICPTISSVAGFQTCDPIFPVIFKDGKPFIRGSIFIVGFNR